MTSNWKQFMSFSKVNYNSVILKSPTVSAFSGNPSEKLQIASRDGFPSSRVCEIFRKYFNRMVTLYS